MDVEISYCVVNNDGREYLLACLEAIREHDPSGTVSEVLVLDNASTDGSVEAVRESFPEVQLITVERKQGKATNDSLLLQKAKGRLCLLLNEDSELLPGSVEALRDALESEPRAGAAGAQLEDGDGVPYACAWKFPGVRSALVGALFLHRRLTVQSGGPSTREVDWVQSSAMMVRREAAAEIGYLDPDFFIYYDECDFCLRLAQAGWTTLYVPAARAIHHDQLATDLSAGLPRIVEFHRNRDLFMRKHHSRAAALTVRVLTAFSYGVRSLVALILPGAPAGVYRAHARQALFPYRGESIRDRSEATG